MKVHGFYLTELIFLIRVAKSGDKSSKVGNGGSKVKCKFSVEIKGWHVSWHYTAVLG